MSDDFSQDNDELRKSSPPATVRREIALRLTQIEEQMSGLKREQQALHTQWNATLTICRLPPEIILEIFAQFSAENRPRSDDTRVSASVGWTKLRLVSRYWNAVACATPGLWRQIDVHQCSSWLALCLERSQNATLDVSFFASDFPLEMVEAMFSLHGHRLRSFAVRFTLYSPWSDSMFKLRVANMQALESLRLSLRTTEEELVATSNDLNLTHSRLPLLHTLRLRHGVLSDMQVLSNLRVLHMTGGSSSLSIDQFIAALASSWRLEHIVLKGFLRRLAGWASFSALLVERRGSLMLGQPPAVLSRLTHLEVHESPTLLSAFLTYLRLPVNATIYIDGEVELFDETATDILPTALPSAPVLYAALPVLRGSIRKVTMNVWPGTYEVDAFASTLDSLHSRLSVLLATSIINNVEVRLSHGMPELTSIFSESPLTDLQLGGRYADINQEHWENVFKTFPDLETISLQGEDCIVAFWTALSSGLDDRHPDDPDAPPPLCPQLKHFVCSGNFDNAATLFATMYYSLLQRAKWGLSMRSLRVFMADDTVDYTEMTDVYASQLIDIVDVVEFSELT
ncbi:hypothetical protein C2E23DRAFT_889703 [Lenzites betulinus]|nr:hypothetical protein C2E23DRAFT_889703 [Lenzites betulinus]